MKRILIVDDREDNLYFLEIILTKSGYFVVSARNGVEALEMLKKETFSMIISDILMPQMDGFKLCMICKNDLNFKKIPFIFFTASYVDKMDEEFALRLGAEKFLRMPMEPDTLLKNVKDILTGSVDNGEIGISKQTVEDNPDIYMLYSERLIKKLEISVIELEREINSRKLAEEALRQQLQLNKTITDNAASCLFMMDKEGRPTFMNQVAETVTGYTLDEVRDMPLHYAIHHHHPDGRPYPMCDCPIGNVHGKLVEMNNYEDIFIRKDGTFFPAICFIAPLEGKCIGSVLEFRDVTEQKKAEEKMYESELQYRSIFEQAAVGIIHVALNGKFIRANERFCQITGYTESEILELTFYDITHPNDINKQEQLRNELLDGNASSYKIEKRYVRKDGVTIWASLTVALVRNPEGNPGYFASVVEDITSRKKMEGALIQSEKFKSLGIVASGISHEINNILAIIMGRTQILDIGFEDYSELKDGLRSIIKASEDGAQIVNKILTFAKTDAKSTDCVFIDMRLLIERAIDFTKPRWKNMAQSKGINYDIDTAGAEEISEVFCNPTELTEVFINIINNAMNAMPDGGCIKFSLKSDESTVFVSISDTGTGISEEVKKKIFDPFFTTRLPQGTGLGMSLVYSIIKRHNGEIEVESEIGKGATFHISIPIYKEMVQNVVSPDKPSRDKITRKLRILVVDDEKDICKILERFLATDGHIVKTVDNGAEAIDLAGKEQFDLVLSDLVMPGKTGYDVVTALNKLEKRPKIGILTGWNRDLISLEKKNLKVDFIVKKPLRLSEITEHINDLFAIND